MDRQAGADSSSAAQADGAAGFSTLAGRSRVEADSITLDRDRGTLEVTGQSAHVSGVAVTGAKEAPMRRPRVVTIAIDGSTKEEWLAGKLLEHSVSLAREALCAPIDVDATITVGERTATVKVTR